MSEISRSSGGCGIPPPALYAAGFGLGLVAEVVAPTPGPPLPIAIVVGVAGLLVWMSLDLLAMREFRRAGTEVSPSRPSVALVTEGPYRWTRNPMYVGMAVLHASLAVALGVLWSLLLLVPVLVLVHLLFVRREERGLGSAFGDHYARYRSSVRRWL